MLKSRRFHRQSETAAQGMASLCGYSPKAWTHTASMIRRFSPGALYPRYPRRPREPASDLRPHRTNHDNLRTSPRTMAHPRQQILALEEVPSHRDEYRCPSPQSFQVSQSIQFREDLLELHQLKRWPPPRLQD